MNLAVRYTPLLTPISVTYEAGISGIVQVVPMAVATKNAEMTEGLMRKNMRCPVETPLDYIDSPPYAKRSSDSLAQTWHRRSAQISARTRSSY